MTGSAPGHVSRSEEPQCYNCGASGHWVIACPEPTRQTPAGLSAWKKSAGTGHGHGRGKDQHHGGSRKARGPIITKYAPPPPPTPPPPPPPAAGAHGAYFPPPAGPYYPPPGAAMPGHPPYPPQYPHSHPAPYPPPQAAAGYQAPPYQQPSYPQHPYPPPASYGSHPPGHGPSYPASIPARPPPVATLPPRYPPYPTPQPDGNSYGHLPPHPPSHTPPRPPTHQPPYASYSTHQQTQPPYPPPSARASGPGHQAAPPPKTLPPAPSLPLPEGLHHSLPPKPPKVNHDNQDSQRGNRNKRKHDRQNRQRDSRHKDLHGQRGPQNTRQPNDHRGGRRTNQALGDVPASLPRKVDIGDVSAKAHPEAQASNSDSPKGDPGKSTNEAHETQESVQPNDAAEVDLDKLDDWDWELATLFKDAPPSRGPDEVGAPLPETYTDQILFPRKWDAKCLVSKYVKADNVDDFMKPIHETVLWPRFEFDPAFLLAGKFPNGEPLADYLDQIKSFDFSKIGSLPTKPAKSVDRMSKSSSPSNGRTEAHFKKSPAATADSDANSDTEAFPDLPDHEARRHEDDEQEADTSQISPTLPRTRIRKRSRERRQSPKASRDSRRSSVSSQSSDLSSLEAELLGRPSKRKRANDKARRRRLDTHQRQQPGRWPSVAGSAYSRRW